jgi:hypothetical protein
MVRSYPIHLGRAEDGSWQVYAAAFVVVETEDLP